MLMLEFIKLYMVWGSMYSVIVCFMKRQNLLLIEMIL